MLYLENDSCLNYNYFSFIALCLGYGMVLLLWIVSFFLCCHVYHTQEVPKEPVISVYEHEDHQNDTMMSVYTVGDKIQRVEDEEIVPHY